MCKNCAFDFIVGADARVCPSKRPCLPASMPICLLRNEYFSRLLHHELPPVLNVDTLRQFTIFDYSSAEVVDVLPSQ